MLLPNNFNFLWLVVIISFICFANARQIRYNRYNTEVIEEDLEVSNANRTDDKPQNDEQATVREIKVAPYPASGFRPSKAFNLPNEISVNTDDRADVPVTDEITSTTPAFESATLAVEAETDNQNSNNNNDGVYVEAGEDVDATTEINLAKAPYPAAGFQPRIPFLLPTDNLAENNDDSATDLAITEIPEEIATDEPLDTETNIGFSIQIPAIVAGKDLVKILFKNQQQPQEDEEENRTEFSITEMPEENSTDKTIDIVKEAPYPAAGYRPSRAFLLPSEQLTMAETMEDEPKQESTPKDDTLEDVPKQESTPKEDNSKHPACGSSTNPLAPKPLDGGKEDPDSELIVLNDQFHRKNQQIINVPVRLIAQPIQTVQPLLISRPFVYTAHLQSW